jgi:glycosyltransferase involved in cell wall biosynthesis
MELGRPRLLFLVTEDWYFWSHRVGLALAARDEGFEVLVAARAGPCAERIRRAGLRLLPLRMLRRGTPGLRDLAAIAEIFRIYRRARPDLVHHVALKPVICGSWAARLARVPAVVNAIAGLGSAFIGGGTGSWVVRAALRPALRAAVAMPGSVTIFQNRDDQADFARAGILGSGRATVIRGCGVDTALFAMSGEPQGPPVVMLPARMLWDKGVGEFVEAARLVSRRGVTARFVLVGMVDPTNPSAIPESQLRDWRDDGLVEWWGHRDNMPATLAAGHVVVLPSYREGLPKVLLEAAASGRAIVATDVPGCREIVRHGVNGLLVPPKDARALAAAISSLVEDRSFRQEAGRRGRQIVDEEFSLARIAGETISAYREVIDGSLASVVARARRAGV